MGDIETTVAAHYSVGDLGSKILAGLKAAGKDLDNLTIDDLSVIDEFHIGGRQATDHLLGKLAPTPEQNVVDVGCGIGGASRAIALQSGCTITGIDLTAEYIDVARELSRLTGLEGQTVFQAGSALDMPFEDAVFDAAVTMHVAMHIEDRARLYGEVARVTKSAARFCVYDVMKKGPDTIEFPVPWAESAETSFLVSPEEMGPLLEDAGFEILEVEDRTPFAFEYIRQRVAAAAAGPAELGPHIVMGPTAKEKLQNIRVNLEKERIAPVQIVAVRR